METIGGELVNKELLTSIGVGYDRRPLYRDSLIHLGDNTVNALKGQNRLIMQFYSAVSEIGRLALNNQIDSSIAHILFSENIPGMGIDYHRRLNEFGWKIPLMYRTDQSINGKIFEIQAPGSGWGDIPMLFRILSNNGVEKERLEKYRQEFIAKFVYAIKKITGKDKPRVGLFLDASSNPASMRYLMAITSEYIRYWGMDASTKMDKIDFAVFHSAISFIALNYCRHYTQMAQKGSLSFALPPNLLYDQKIIYALPFMERTKSFFSDEVRNLFPYTTYIFNNGFLLEDGSFITIDEFANLKKSERKYYLKYAGPDTNRNWGSKSVYRLNETDSLEILVKAGKLAEQGEAWIIQSDITRNSDKTNECYSEDINSIIAGKNHIKVSAFYTPYDYLGSKVMYRRHFKVHGNEETMVGIGVGDE